MSNDDDNSVPGESSPQGDRSRARDTLISSEFAAPIRDALEASTRPDFEAPTTQLSTTLPDFADDDREIRKTVDRVWDEMFEAEETRPSQLLSFPEDRAAALATESEVEEVDELAPMSPADHSFEGSIDDLEIEDGLPEPIRDDDHAATLEDAATDEVPAHITPYPGDNTPITAFADARTELLDSPFELDPIVARLVAIDGPAEGQEFFASAMRSTVGRGTSNAIVVPDLAMSREHFEVVRNPDDSFTLVDLESINGTTLNGTRVREADLLHGDRVEAGQTRFRFVITPHPPASTRDRRVRAAQSTLAGARKAAESPSANRLIVTVGVGALIVSLALFAIVATLKFAAPEAATQQPAPDPTEYYLRGVEAVKQRDWDSAYAEFSAARTLDPTLQGVDLQLRRIEKERGARMALEESAAHHEAGRDHEALKSLENIPQDSVYVSDAERLALSIRTRQVSDLYQQAQQALSIGDKARARQLADDILERVPSHRGALQIVEDDRPEAPVEEQPEAPE